MKDRSGNIINAGDQVEMPEPTNDDSFNCSFVGRVLSIHHNGLIDVIDQDDDAFSVEGNRVEVVRG